MKSGRIVVTGVVVGIAIVGISVMINVGVLNSSVARRTIVVAIGIAIAMEDAIKTRV